MDSTIKGSLPLGGGVTFLLGTLLAWKMDGIFQLPIFILGIIAVVLIMLCTYYTGEYCDVLEDRLSASMERNTFSGGSQVNCREPSPLQACEDGKLYCPRADRGHWANYPIPL